MTSIKGSLWLCHMIFLISIIEGVCNMKAPCIGMEGKMLPSVTTEDNGDVLMVVDGEWSKGEASSGGGGVLVANLTAIGQDVRAIDCSYNQLVNASFAVVRTEQEDMMSLMPLVMARIDSEVYEAEFGVIGGEENPTLYASDPDEPMTSVYPEG